MRRPVWLLVLLSAVLAAACSSGSSAGSGTTTSTVSAPGSTAASGDPTTTNAPAPQTGVIPYFLRNTVIGAGERRPTVGDAHVEAVNALITGLSEADKAAGLINTVPPGTVVRKLTVDNGVATIDLSRAFETRDTQPQVAQVVYTLTQFPEIQKVKFLVEGTDNGATGVPPVGRADLPKYTPDILLESPTPGVPSTATVKVSGTIDSTYDSFPYSIQTAFGQEIAKGSINAKFGSGRKRFDQTVDVPGDASGGVTFIVGSPSGSKMQPFSVPFTLTR